MESLWTVNSFSECDYFHSLLLGPSNKDNKQQSNREIDSLQNFIINMVLPMPAVGSSQMSSKITCLSKACMQFAEPIGRMDITLAGSSSEGLFLPRMTHMRGNTFYSDFPDEDMKFVLENLVICSKRTNAFATIEPSPLSPSAFVQLKFNKNFGTRKHTRLGFPADDVLSIKPWDPSLIVSDNGLVNRVKFINYFRSILKDYMLDYDNAADHFVCMKGLADISFSAHGPAITVEALDKSTNSLHSRDYVLSLPCPTWPQQASEWTTRNRVWPPENVIRKVVRKGCHIVPKAFKPTKSRYNEFIFSFSLCDKIIADTLTLHQKRSYMLFKFVFKYSINRVERGLHSYLCKTTFLRLCERKPAVEWTEYNPVECLILLLKDFKRYLQVHHMPHFYINDYNLISELSTSKLDACIKDIDDVLEAPANTVLRLTDNHRFHWLSRDSNLDQRLRPLFSDRLVTRRMLKTCALSFMSEMLDRGEVQLVIPLLCKQWSGDYFTASLDKAIDVVEKICNAYQHHEDIVNFMGLLANLYHQQGRKNLLTFGSDPGFIMRSLQLYEGILSDVGCHIWIYGAYYDLLFQFLEYEKIVRHFLSKVYLKGLLEESGIYTVLTFYNDLTTHPVDFATFIHYSIYLPSPGYIMFKVILAYNLLSKNSKSQKVADLLRIEARKLLVYYDKWVTRKCELYSSLEDDVLFYLLSFAANEVGHVRIRDASVAKGTGLGTSIFENVMYKGKSRTTSIRTESRRRNRPYLKRDVVSAVRQPVAMRPHPYSEVPDGEDFGDHLPDELRFKTKRVRIGRFLHQTVV